MKTKTLKPYSTIKRYSESFKLAMLEELSKGNCTKHELTQRYGLGGATLNRWIKKYSRKELESRKVRIEMPGEVDKIKKLKKRIAELEKALVDTQLDHLHATALLECALEELGTEKEEYEKKRGAKRSRKR